MKMMKVFDCQDMPEHIRMYYFNDYCSCMSLGNDCYINLYVEMSKDESAEWNEMMQWFIDNGAEPDEEVIISHWW